MVDVRGDSGQPGHPFRLIKAFAVRLKKVLLVVLIYPYSAQRRDWSDWVDNKAVFTGSKGHFLFVFAMLQLNYDTPLTHKTFMGINGKQMQTKKKK